MLQIIINQTQLPLKQYSSLVNISATPGPMGCAVCHHYLCSSNRSPMTLPLWLQQSHFPVSVFVCALRFPLLVSFRPFVNMCLCVCVCVCIECVAVLACFQSSPVPTICTHSIRGRRTDWLPHRETTQAGVLAVVSRRARTASTPIRLACVSKHTHTDKNASSSLSKPRLCLLYTCNVFFITTFFPSSSDFFFTSVSLPEFNS